MQHVSDELMGAFEADQASAFPRRFHEWWQSRIDRSADAQITEKLIFAHRDEFELAGVETDEEQFLFLYARALMPELGDRDYLETMDAIFDRKPESDRMKMLAAIAEKFGHRG